MSINSKNFAALLSPMIDEWYDTTYKDAESYPTAYTEIYRVKDTDKLTNTVASVNPVGLHHEQDMNGGHTEYEDPSLGPATLFTQHKYSKGMRITEAIWKFNKTDQLRDLSEDMARSARWTTEYNACLPLSLGWGSGVAASVGTYSFSGTTQSFVYADGCSLFHATHPIGGTAAMVNEDQYQLGSTFSNTVDAALDASTLATAILRLRNQPNGIGIPDILRTPDTLIVSPGNELIAKQLLNASAVNTSGVNVGVPTLHAPFNIKLVVIPYFLDSSIWFLRTALPKTFGKFYWNEKPGTPQKEKDFDSDVLKVRSKMYFCCGFSDCRGWVGGGQTVSS